MKPDWDKLMKQDFGPNALIADVDCTSDGGKALCNKVGVRGYPTIKWGDPSSLEDYNGGRDLSALRAFAEKNLKPMCSPNNIDLCDDEKKKELEGLLKMSASELEEKIAEKEQLLKDAEELFEKEVEKLQTAYQKLQDDKEKTETDVKESGLGMMKAVKAHKAKDGKDEL